MSLPTTYDAASNHFQYFLIALFIAVGLSPVVTADARAQADVWFYAVERGENPWSITRRYLRDGLRYWQPLIERNGIESPRHIPPGTIVSIPAQWLRVSPTAARIEQISGDVSLLRGTDVVAATEGAPLRGGETLTTAVDSTALVGFANGTRMLVTQQSSVRFTALSSYANTLMVDATVRLLAGRIETEVGDVGSLDRLEVESPVAVSAVRGTRFRLGTVGDTDRVEVLTGRVDMAAAGRSRRVDAGQGTLTRAGTAPAPPRRLLPPPVLRPGDDRLDRLPLTARLEPVPGAVAYRVQIAPSPSFNALLVDRVLPEPVLRLGDLADGTYALRARAIDAAGIEGRDLAADIVVDARPQPPFLIAPPPDGRNRTQPPEFRWAEVEEAGGYRFRLEPGPSRGVDITLPRVGRYSLPFELPLGAHRWRVATVAADGERGPWSDVQTFEQLEPTPVLDEAALAQDDGRTSMRWPDAGERFRYRVQIARDRAFEKIVVDQTVDDNHVTFEAAGESVVYVRVAVVEPDGYEGPFGAVNQVDLPPTPWWPLLLLPLAIILIL